MCVAERPSKVPRLSPTSLITVSDDTPDYTTLSSSSSSGTGSSGSTGSSTSDGSFSTSASSSQSSFSTDKSLSSATTTGSSSRTHSTLDTDHSDSSRDHTASNSQTTSEVSDMHLPRLSPTQATAAISFEQRNTTSDGVIEFAEASVCLSGNATLSALATAATAPGHFVERSSLQTDSHRIHPYRAGQNHRQQRWQHNHCNNRRFTFRQYKPHEDIRELLQSHSISLFEFAKRPINPNVLVDLLPSIHDDDVDFTSHRFVRSTRTAAQQILGETGVVDELKDTVFTSRDIKHFDHKKKMAQELDRVLEGARNGAG